LHLAGNAPSRLTARKVLPQREWFEPAPKGQSVMARPTGQVGLELLHDPKHVLVVQHLRVAERLQLVLHEKDLRRDGFNEALRSVLCCLPVSVCTYVCMYVSMFMGVCE